MRLSLALILCALAPLSFAATCPSGYGYYRTITVQTGQTSAGPHSSFPMLILNPSASLATVANGGRVTNANGYDIVPANSSGTLLPFELVGHGTASTTYSATSGNIEMHVQVSSLNDGSVVNLCYGNGAITTYQGDDATTWSGYTVVHHFGTSASLGLTESVGGTTATNSGFSAVAGAIGGAASSAGGSSLITTAATAGLTAFTMSHWVQLASLTSFQLFMGQVGGGANNSWYTGFNNTGVNGMNVAGWSSGGAVSNPEWSGSMSATGTWYDMALTWNGTTLVGYKNGATLGAASSGSTALASLRNPSQATKIGNVDGTNSGLVSGSLIDEVRVYGGARAAGWLLTEYNNQVAPGTFYAVGSELVPGVASFTASPTVVAINQSGDVVLTLTGTGTAWGATTFTVSGVSGVAKVRQVVGSTTAATLTITTSSTTGTLTISDGTLSTTITIGGSGAYAFVGVM